MTIAAPPTPYSLNDTAGAYTPSSTLYSFDSGTQSWTESGGATCTDSATYVHDGANALKVSKSVSGAPAFYLTSPTDSAVITNGQTIAAWVYLPSGTSGTWTANMAMKDSTGTFQGPSGVTPLVAGQWTQIDWTVPSTIWSGHEAIGVALNGSGVSSSTVALYVDTVSQGTAAVVAGVGTTLTEAVGVLNAENTIYSTYPGPGLTAIHGDNTNDDTAILQAHLNYAHSLGGGRVVVSKPGSTVKLNSGLTIPTGVQLVSDEITVLSFAGIGSGTAITVNDTNCTPLVGLNMVGPDSNPVSTPSDASTGISVTGVGLSFRDNHVQHFGRAIDVTHSNTYIITFAGGGIGNCGMCVNADLDGGGVSNSGERITFRDVTFFNSNVGFRATGNGLSFYLTNCSIDFCVEFGFISNAFVYITACHLETGGTGAGAYLFDVEGNAHVAVSNTNIIMGGGRTGGLYTIFRYDEGPANYGYGSARFDNTNCYWVDPAGNGETRFSEDLISWPAGTTSLSIYTPYPLRWMPFEATFCATDGYTQPVADTVLVTSINVVNGQITLTSGASSTSQRWVRLKV